MTVRLSALHAAMRAGRVLLRAAFQLCALYTSLLALRNDVACPCVTSNHMVVSVREHLLGISLWWPASSWATPAAGLKEVATATSQLSSAARLTSGHREGSSCVSPR
jgi:hypothetical protein